MSDKLTPSEVDAAGQRALREGYLRREPVALDQFLNASTGGNLDETISARAWRWSLKRHGFIGWRAAARGLNWALSKIQPQHGARAAAGDLARAERVEDTEADALGERPK